MKRKNWMKKLCYGQKEKLYVDRLEGESENIKQDR